MAILNIVVLGALVRLLLVADNPLLCSIFFVVTGILLNLPSLLHDVGLWPGLALGGAMIGISGILIWLLVATGKPVWCAITYVLAVVLTVVLLGSLGHRASPLIVLLPPCFRLGWSYLYFHSLQKIESIPTWWLVFALGLPLSLI